MGALGTSTRCCAPFMLTLVLCTIYAYFVVCGVGCSLLSKRLPGPLQTRGKQHACVVPARAALTSNAVQCALCGKDGSCAPANGEQDAVVCEVLLW